MFMALRCRSITPNDKAMKRMRNEYDFIAGVVARLFKHRHKWQVRGRSRYQNPTYRVCLRCRQAQEWKGGLNGKFVNCDPIHNLDAQFDENDKYIFNH